jgi:hypothetical protein
MAHNFSEKYFLIIFRDQSPYRRRETLFNTLLLSLGAFFISVAGQSFIEIAVFWVDERADVAHLAALYQFTRILAFADPLLNPILVAVRTPAIRRRLRFYVYLVLGVLYALCCPFRGESFSASSAGADSHRRRRRHRYKAYGTGANGAHREDLRRERRRSSPYLLAQDGERRRSSSATYLSLNSEDLARLKLLCTRRVRTFIYILHKQRKYSVHSGLDAPQEVQRTPSPLRYLSSNLPCFIFFCLSFFVHHKYIPASMSFLSSVTVVLVLITLYRTEKDN